MAKDTWNGLVLLRRLVLVASVIALGGCVAGREAPLNVELCAVDQGGVTAAIRDLKYIAQLHGLTLIDNSAQTKAELRVADAGRHVKYGIDNLVMIYLQKGNSVKVIASSIGLPKDQILLSFFYENNDRNDQVIAEKIYLYFRSKYKTEKLSAGKEAVGIKSCRS